MGLMVERFPELVLRTREHLFLTGVSTITAVLIGIPIGIYISKRTWLRAFVFGVAGTLQTVPSLAMLAFLLALLGKIGATPAIIALTLYAFLPIIRNTVTGLGGVPPEIIEASEGMGMTPRQQMKTVKLPLSVPVIMAGVKTAAVIGVGIATLSAFIGAGGLGEFINRGLSLSDTRLILLGAIPSALLALYVSFAVSAVEWGLNKRKRRGMGALSGRTGRLVSILPLLLLFLIGALGGAWQASQERTAFAVRIGSKNFTEQLIIAEMMAERIELTTGLGVERMFNLGGTMICHSALIKDEIDLYAEYTGTALTTILKIESRPTTPEEVYGLVSREYAERFNLEWLGPFGFNNTYALAVRKEAAERHGWEKISDLRASADALRAGFTSEFSERPDGYPGFRESYGISFGDVVDLDPALMYDAVRKGQVDIIAAFSTDSRIPGYNLYVLRDDRSFFPPYYAAPVVGKDILRAYPEIGTALAPLAGVLDERSMQRLNFEVDRKKRDIKAVVREFLEANSLLD